jgi:hypothetical protein
MAENTKFKCEFCKQDYASYKSRWLHIKKYHDIKPVENRKTHKKYPQNSTKNTMNQCEYCKKIYSRKDSLTRHQTDYCKMKLDDDILKDDKIKEIVQNEIEKFKAEFFKSMKSNTNINNSNSNNTNCNNNTNNGTINNINLVIPLGKENFNDVLSDAQKISIVKANDKAIFKFTELIYTDPQFEKFRNISISNINGEFGNAYDEKIARYVLMKKMEILNKYGWNRLCDIEEFIDYLENKNIDVGNIDKLTVLIDRYAKDDEFKQILNNDLVVLLYNYNKFVKRNLKKVNKEIEI